MSPALYANAAALSGLVIAYGVFVLLGSKPPWRWFKPWLPLLAGCLSFRVLGWYMSAVHPLLLPYLEHLSGSQPPLRFIIDVGLREEFIKLLFALPCLLGLRRLASGPSALLTAGMVGLGFATMENRWFFAGHAEPTLLVGRVFSTTWLHAAGTGLCGAAFMQAWQKRPHAWTRFTLTFLIVAVAHGLYDWAPASGWVGLQTGGTSWLSQCIVIALVAWFFILDRQTPPAGAQTRAAAIWFALGATIQYAIALGMTWHRWHTLEAVGVCARECFWFLPTICFTTVWLATIPMPTSAAVGFIKK